MNKSKNAGQYTAQTKLIIIMAMNNFMAKNEDLIDFIPTNSIEEINLLMKELRK